MHTCPDCGKAMATAGGLEIHVEMQHAPPPAPAPEPEFASEVVAERTAVAPMQARATSPANTRSPVLRGYDPTLPLTALLVLAMLVAGIGAAVHRSTTPTHQIVASAPSGASTPSGQATPTTITPVPHQTPASPALPPAGSPAAIPPAGSQPPAAAQTASACEQVIASLSTRPSKRTVDLAAQMRANTFPALPLAGYEHPNVDALTRYDTVQQFLDDTFDPGDPHAATYGARMTAAGFIGAEDTAYSNAGSIYGALILRFASAGGARDFNRATLSDFCSQGILENAKPMPGLSGGMNYLQLEDGAPPFRSTFVAGDTVVRLRICHCVQAPDDQVLAGQWAQTVASAVGAG